jgi:glutathione S-transferase
LESFGIHQSQPKTQIPAKRANGEAALAIMDKRFERNIWLVGSAPTIADIALFS